jgi:coenzyme F420-reducing hydrogenase delta subunit
MDFEHYVEKDQDNDIHIMSLPCSGKVTIPYMVKAFETGADCVVIVTCKEGQCHNLEGNLRATKRTQAVDSLLEEVGMGKGHITVVQMKDGGIEQVMKEIQVFCSSINKSKSSAKLSPEKTK